MHQAASPYHASVLSSDRDVANVASHTPIVVRDRDLASLLFLHLKPFGDLIQATAAPQPGMPSVLFLHFFACNCDDSEVYPKPILIDLGWIEVAFDLWST